MSGTLEAHTNGFRYSTMRQEEKVDIMYRNIKHAFFQPAEKEMITLVHFHLHNYIMVGTKKTKDVQFYVEVCSAMSLYGSHSMLDQGIRRTRWQFLCNVHEDSFVRFIFLLLAVWGLHCVFACCIQYSDANVSEY